MSALDSGSIMLQYGNLFVGDDAGSVVDCGAVRDVKFMGDPVRTKVLSDNRGEIVNKIRLQGNFEATLLEPGNMAILENIFKGIVTKTSTAGSATPVTGEVTASGSWAYGRIIFFAQQSGTQISPTSVTVTGSVDGLRTVVTDYDIVQDPATLKWGVAIKDSVGVTTLTQTITLAYTSTPSAALVLTGGTNQTATVRYIKIEGPSEDDSSVKRTVVIASAICSSPLLMEFVDVENGGDVGKMPVRFEGLKGVEWTITDAINPT